MSNKKIVVSSLVWKFLERIGAQAIGLIVSIFLARLVEPSDYGYIALITVFITILNVFVESGFSSALIQKKDADDLDFSTVFYYNYAISIILYILLFFFSPIIANFYENVELTNVIRVLGLILIVSGIKSVQVSYVSKHLLFKKFFFSTLFGTLISGVIGIYMAYNGYGLWALVVQQLANGIIDTIILWFTVSWKPKLIFSFKRLKELFSFGSKIFIGSIIDAIYGNLYDLVIGKKYSNSDLAFYNRGKQFPQMLIENIDCSIQSVMFPIYSKYQDDLVYLKKMVRKSMLTSCFIIFPMMVGLIVIAKPLVIIILTEKWFDSIIFLQLLCIVYAFHPIQSVNIQLMKGVGSGNTYLLYDIIKKIFGLIVLAITLQFGVKAMAIGMIICSVFEVVLNSFAGKKFINYGFFQQLYDILPIMIISIVMGLITYSLAFIVKNLLLLLFLQVLFGFSIYILLAYILKNESLYEILNLLKKYKTRR